MDECGKERDRGGGWIKSADISFWIFVSYFIT